MSVNSFDYSNLCDTTLDAPVIREFVLKQVDIVLKNIGLDQEIKSLWSKFFNKPSPTLVLHCHFGNPFIPDSKGRKDIYITHEDVLNSVVADFLDRTIDSQSEATRLQLFIVL